MKVALISIACTIISFVVVFGMAGFLANDFNSSNWSSDGRFFYLLTSFGASVILSAVFCNLKPSEGK